MNLKELDSFNLSDAIKFHDSLNPKLWQHNRLRPEVKKQLKKIAEDFIEELGVSGLDVVDLTVSGSNAAYSYTPHSDLDLHILIDMGQLSNDEVYRELFTAKKTIYNDTHDIKIHGVPVELYVQDANEPVISLGEYSLLQDKWIKVPVKKRANFDQNLTSNKYEKLLALVQHALKYKDIDKLNNVIKKIRQYRQAGLDRGGEFSPENLAYKALRNQDYISKLYDLRDKLHSEELTIETMYQSRLLNKPTLTARMLAAKHDVPVKHILDQLKKGIQVEKEHTTYGQTAREIALDHLAEDPNYYTKLKKANLEEEKYDELPEKVYHVTPSVNVDNILMQGLLPKVGDRSRKIEGEKPAIYCFPDKVSMEDAMMNWLGDEFDEDEQLALLEIFTTGLKGQVTDGAEYEVAITSKIPPQNIRVLSRDLATPITENTIKLNDNTRAKEWIEKVYSMFPTMWQNNHVMTWGEGDDQQLAMFELVPSFSKRGAVEVKWFQAYPLRQGVGSKAMKILQDLAKQDGIALTLYPWDKGQVSQSKLTKFYKGHGFKPTAPGAKNMHWDPANIAEDETMQFAATKTAPTNPYGGFKDKQYRGSISEASGYIPSEKEKNDPRFKTALTVDVKPDSIKKNAKSFYWKTSRAGIPPTLNPSGKL